MKDINTIYKCKSLYASNLLSKLKSSPLKLQESILKSDKNDYIDFNILKNLLYYYKESSSSGQYKQMKILNNELMHKNMFLKNIWLYYHQNS